MSKKIKSLTIFSDGGSRGNPGPAGIGAVLYDEEGKAVSQVSKYIGIATNNEAEYLAAIYGFLEAVHMKAHKVVINLDSQLVARQLKGEYKVKDRDLKKFFDLALNILKEFDTVEIREIPREGNKEADRLVNKAINLEGPLV